MTSRDVERCSHIVGIASDPPPGYDRVVPAADREKQPRCVQEWLPCNQ
jgi:hypothetical protein